MNSLFAELESGVKDGWLMSYVAVIEASYRRHGIELPKQEAKHVFSFPTTQPLLHPVALAVSEYTSSVFLSSPLAGIAMYKIKELI